MADGTVGMGGVVTGKEPRFWLTVNGLRYGARFTTIAEQAMCLAEIERLTNGNFGKWLKDEDPTLQGVAAMVQASVYLNRVICQWPTDTAPIDFLNTDDSDLVSTFWQAYTVASEDFRKSGTTSRES